MVLPVVMYTGVVAIVGTEMQCQAPTFDMETSSWSLEHLGADKNHMTLQALNFNSY